ncbi:MAG: hypothetical protein ACOX2E_09225 [Syntrophaceticus sp.]|jgi:hypothetical protein
MVDKRRRLLNVRLPSVLKGNELLLRTKKEQFLDEITDNLIEEMKTNGK